ncbi:MAG: tail fiber protein [Methylicorpusculum sp.]|uniref:phage tail protein n=1 Tax=Methylicorpusculum sp. TaxID=2713644 RepID=UPI00271CFC14|nr:tail fiber protein [Methylicorpusculum sp.]MDO8846142.1 tail fiber protein [Methylicorpusculum sp.]MDP2203788.1 tail fiber protein [Methylicorpusculum sp.]
METFVGQIQLFAFNYAPKGWLICNGAMLPIEQHVMVYTLLGTTYGGDGQRTFALPNLVGKEPAPGLVYCICVEGLFPSRP